MEYFHVVFTLPPAAAEIAFQNKQAVYALLFRSAAQTLQVIARRSQAPGRRDRVDRGAAHLLEWDDPRRHQTCQDELSTLKQGSRP